MNNKTYATVAAVAFVAILGAQIYVIFILNDRMNHSFLQGQPANMPRIQMPLRSTSYPSFPNFQDKGDFLQNISGDFYPEIRFVQNKIQQIFDDVDLHPNINTVAYNLNSNSDVDLEEKSDRYIVTANAPDGDENSVNVELDGKILHFSIKTKSAKTEKDSEHTYEESSMGEFEHVLTLPGPGNASKITTDFHNGLLTITIPKP